MNLARSRRRRLFATLFALGLSIAACSNSSGTDPDRSDGGSGGSGSSAPGVTDTEIRFAALGTDSNNPTGACMLTCFVDGIDAYFAYRNSEGGVHGRDMVLTTRIDDQLAKNKEGALEIITADDTFATFGATQLPTGWGDLYDAGIPQYVWAIQPTEMYGRDSVFGNAAPQCLDCPNRTFTYVAHLKGATKIAALGYGIADSSKKCVQTISDTIDLYSGEYGQEVAYVNNDLAFGLPNGIGPEVSAMKAAGVDMVIMCLDLNGAKTLAQELQRQGMGDVPMFHPNTYDHAFVAGAGDLFEGDIVGAAFRPFEADPGDTGLADYLKWMKEKGHEPTEAAMNGWINADLAYQGILAAGPDFTRDSVVAATNKMTEYSADGLINPIDWSRQHDSPTTDDPTTHGYKQECFAYVEVHGGKFQVVGGTREKPFVCFPNEDRSWSEPTLTSFS